MRKLTCSVAAVLAMVASAPVQTAAVDPAALDDTHVKSRANLEFRVAYPGEAVPCQLG